MYIIIYIFIKDPLILQYLTDILHNIRSEYICIKVQAYDACKFKSLENVIVIGLFII